VGVGIISIYLAVVNYMTDAFACYAASTFSTASLGRNTFDALLPLASYNLFSTLGYDWAGALLGFVGLALSAVPVVLALKRKQVRVRSSFMSDAVDAESRDGGEEE